MFIGQLVWDWAYFKVIFFLYHPLIKTHKPYTTAKPIGQGFQIFRFYHHVLLW